MSEHLPQDTELVDFKRQAYLLDQLHSTPTDKRTASELNKRIPKQIQDELELFPSLANELRSTLTAQGMITEQRLKRSVIYTITDSGRAWIEKHAHYIPLQKADGKVNHVADVAIRQGREAHLLLQLIDAPSAGYFAAELKKKSVPEKLMLNPATARHLRGDLVVRQFIAVARTSSKSERFSLTQAGISKLVTLSFDVFDKLSLSGLGFTKLLSVARGCKIVSPDPITGPPEAPTTKQLESTVMEIFIELHRERHSVSGLVPIHEIRAAIRKRLGNEAASHSVLDSAILGLWRGKRLRIVPIVDRGSASAEELQDSISGVGETLFYLEANHG